MISIAIRRMMFMSLKYEQTEECVMIPWSKKEIFISGSIASQKKNNQIFCRPKCRGRRVDQIAQSDESVNQECRGTEPLAREPFTFHENVEPGKRPIKGENIWIAVPKMH
jgi:hypothetical protein